MRIRRRPPLPDYTRDFDQVETELRDIHRDVAQLLDLAEHPRHARTITISATITGRTVLSTQFPEGHPILINADVQNKDGVPVPDTLTYTATSGTLTADETTLKATLTGAAQGQVTVSATDPTGLSGSLTFEVVDPTPASITLSAVAG
ncbi:hypothetical protein [Catenulispora pinisilvae]|uniref:hypothetical protein n=1 Tax=Catenulispora pinisilvae TaxID=2705253 RepID=UPI00189230D4|nr:hypothetical protein [Catenulispora pinisilvae]